MGSLAGLIRQLLAAAAVVGAATVISRAAGANAVTAGFGYLIAVLAGRSVDRSGAGDDALASSRCRSAVRQTVRPASSAILAAT